LSTRRTIRSPGAGLGEGCLEAALELGGQVREVLLQAPRVALVHPHAAVLYGVDIADDLVCPHQIDSRAIGVAGIDPAGAGEGVADPAPPLGDGSGGGLRRCGVPGVLEDIRPAVQALE
jgi:hypothetical protein